MVRTRIMQVVGAEAARVRAGSLLHMRVPHHTVSMVGMLDEYRLAIGGVLYLDEAGNFRREVISRLCACLRSGTAHPVAILVDCSTGTLRDPEVPRGVPAGDLTVYLAKLARVVEDLEEAVEVQL